MIYPKINIYTDDSGDFEAQYICFLAKGVSYGEYQDNGYLVLPHLEPGNSRSLYFPNLGYSADFWRAIKFNPNINLSTSFPKSAIDEVKSLLSKKHKNDIQAQCQKIASDWKMIEKEFFSDVSKFLDMEKTLSKIEKINVLITPYGTIGSFNPPRIGNKFNLLATSRVDFPAGNIAAVILQTLYIIKNNIGGEIREENYIKRMATINFLLTGTTFSKFYPKYKDPAKTEFGLSKNSVSESEKYLTKLGFPTKDMLEKINFDKFTSQETELMQNLIKHKGNLVSFDRVSQILWGNDSFDKYSPAAMAKVIENIRRKIKEQGINKELIFTKRGKGYLVN